MSSRFLTLIFLTCFSQLVWAETPREIVERFFTEVFVDGKVRAAAERYVAPDYIQHNPDVPDGRDAFVREFESFYKKHPQARSSIKRVIAEGDLVVIHNHWQTSPKERGEAIVDIFRVSKGKIVEHWDVIQPIPTKSANTNSMF